jgi:predicted TIM-barrel fold metal-dependent hydrolase
MQVISADSHFIEPPTLWTERLDAKYRDRAPHTVVKDGIIMLVGEDIEPVPISGFCAAGRASEDLVKIDKLGWDAAPKGMFDPASRLENQDRDGILAEILYTSFGLNAMNIRDVELAMATLRVFNDYAAEFSAYDRKRLIPVGAVIPDDVPAAVAELERMAKLGMRGVMIPVTIMQGESYGDKKYDPIWAAMQDLDLVPSLHAGTNRNGINVNRATWAHMYVASPHLMQYTLTDIIMGGVFDRFPKIRLVSVEHDVSWIPHFAFRLDHFAERFVALASIDIKRKPSEYIRDHLLSTFQFEGPGIESMRQAFGSETIMWGNDFPHLDSTWPQSPQIIQETLTERMPAPDVKNVVHDNVKKLYNLDLAA